MKIYVATSWKMKRAALELTDLLRAANHEVDCFCDPSSGRYVFDYTKHPEIFHLNAKEYVDCSYGRLIFQENKKWIDWCDMVILILPSGRSAHLEAGYAVGQGKKLIVVGDMPLGEIEAMYGFADEMFPDYDGFEEFMATKRFTI